MLSVISRIAPASWRCVCPNRGGPLAAATRSGPLAAAACGPLAAATPSAPRGRPGCVRGGGGNATLHICAAGSGWQCPRHKAGSLASKHLPSAQLRVFGNGLALR